MNERPDRARLWQTRCVRGAKGGRAAALLVLAGAIGCGSGGSDSPDAAPPDAAAPDATTCDLTLCDGDCVDTSTSTDHCGGCFQPCTPAQDCASSNCECPTVELVAEDFILAQMDQDMLAPTILGIGLYGDGSAATSALVIGFDDPDTPTDTDIDLSDGAPPFVAIGYDIEVSTQEFRSAYRAQTGTLRLSRRCADGVAGTVTGAALVEVDAEAEEPTPIADGCTASIPSFDFDFGDQCSE
jgi:hypothetical protein